MHLLRRINQWVEWLEHVTGFVTAAVLFSIMVIVFADVGFRYFLNAPLSWSFDLISVYLMVALFFLPLSRTLRENHHISVDIVFLQFGRTVQRLLRLVGYLISAFVFFLIFREAVLRSISQFEAGDVLAGSILWPTWVATAIVALGSALLVFRLVFASISLAISLIHRSDDVVGVQETEDRIHEDISVGAK